MCRAMVICVVLASASYCQADEPRASFVLKSGPVFDLVEVTLKRDGKPLDAKIDVIDERGRKVAGGETGPEGETAFPLPRGTSFTVEIQTEGRTADVIRLYPTTDGIAPARVLLSYGLRPCCRGQAKKAPIIVGEPIAQEQRSDLPWLWLVPLAFIFSGLLLSTAWHNRAAREKAG